jgi:D-galactosamine 6-phosphate deaminase/isomerase
MKKILGLNIHNGQTLTMLGTSHMEKEIISQPGLWKDTYASLLSNKDKISSFLEQVFAIKNLQIILTGAGTSAFIGEILQQAYYNNTGISTKAIPTTDLVTHPGDFFHKSVPVLLVSFARSGDSPESIATFEFAEKLHDVVYHLIITCNPDGQLAKAAAQKKNAFVFILPEGTNDLALAMTSSFPSMTLAGLLISDIKNIEHNEEHVASTISFGNALLDKYIKNLRDVADMNFKRVVFLGSGPLKGTAKESHLKVTEVTNGQIMCQFDSFLGFRHGPKAIIDESTLLIYIFSSDPYVYKYEIDLVKSIKGTDKYLYSIAIGGCLKDLEGLADLIITQCGDTKIPDNFFSICSILPAQILGFYKSLALGLTPDSPSQNGGIHRIVQGVTIYPY